MNMTVNPSNLRPLDWHWTTRLKHIAAPPRKGIAHMDAPYGVAPRSNLDWIGQQVFDASQSQ